MGGEIGRQAAMIGYLNAFGLYTLASLVVLPLIFIVHVPKRIRSAPEKRPADAGQQMELKP